MHLPTLKQLSYFVALAETLHFGKAAKQCFVSQSAFSTAIRELETGLDCQLVDRTNRRVALTPAGRIVAKQAGDCLQSAQHIVDSVSAAREPLTGPLRLGVIPTIAPFLLPKILPKLRREHPKLQLFLTEDQTQRLHEKLLAGDLDIALLALPFNLPALTTEPLFKDPFMLACRQGTQHVDPDNYNFNKLDASSVMLMQDGHCMRDHALDACKLRDTEKLNEFSASSLLSLVEMVDADLAITYLPEMITQSALLKNTRVKLYPLSARNYRTIGLAWHKGSARAEEFRLLGEFIKNNRQR
ncbi:MAG: LysR substrate-binding domain-containing protein [Gammaproteobacteria bacterium]|nr:LysR substrate-binding domain-containing protein [Gammaproteobacteria bacterium]